MFGSFESNGYLVHTELRDFGRKVFVYIIKLRSTFGGTHDKLLRFLGNGISEDAIEEGDVLPNLPTFAVPTLVVTQVIESLNGAVGFNKTQEPEARLQGKLAVMEKYLEDMRMLVFENHVVKK